MSIKSRILLPIAAMITIGIGAAAAIGVSSWLSANTTRDAVHESLQSIADVKTMADAQLGTQRLLDRVLQMTEIVDPKDIADRYTALNGTLTDTLTRLEAGAHTDAMKTETDTLSTALHDWLGNAELVLGLHTTQELPTQELLNRGAKAVEASVTSLAGLAGTQATDVADASAAGTQRMLMIVAGLAVLLLALVGAFATRTVWNIARDLGRMSGVMKDLSAGNLDSTAAGQDRTDELGDMARALAVFQEALRERARLEADQKLDERTKYQRAQMMLRFQQAFDASVAALANGDLATRIDTRFEDAEIQRIADNFNGLLDMLGQVVGNAGEVLGALARMDLEPRMQGRFKGAFDRLQTDTNAVADGLAGIVSQLRDTSGTLKVATGEMLSGANDLSARTSKQAAMIAGATSSMQELSRTISGTAADADGANKTAAQISERAREGEAVIGQAQDAMTRISESSGKISNIIGLIDDIAFQTNLLALNASVEAARAGEAGKGFAVVAVEVRRLAQSAAEASRDVKALIEASAGEVQAGGRLVQQLAAQLNSMFEAIVGNASTMNKIAEKNRQQAQTIEQLSSTIKQMDEMTQHNAALVEETNAAIEQTETEANQLDRLVEQFRLDSKSAAAVQRAA